MGHAKAVRDFLDYKHSTKARIFIAFLLTTMVIAISLSLFWYQRIVRSTTDSIVLNMEMSVGGSLAQIENSVADVKRMHSTVVYETNSLNYLIRDTSVPPTADWFREYNNLYRNLHVLGISLSRTVTGSCVYKLDGATCTSGTLSLAENFLDLPIRSAVDAGNGSDVIFYLDKPRGELDNEVKKYIFIGRAIQDRGQAKAYIVTKLNEEVFRDAFHDAAYPEGFVILTDPNSNIIYDSAPKVFSEYKEKYRSQLRQGQILTPAEGYTLFQKTSPHTGVVVISSMSNAYVQESNRAVRTQLGILLAVSVVMSALISGLISNKITKRLQNLEKNMLRVGNGTMTQLIPIVGQDEVGRLSDTFLQMIEQIQGLLADVKAQEKQKRQMEIKVLRAQISPHFLYNSLNTINYLSLLQNATNIHVLAASLIDLLQAAVDVDEVLVPLADEIRYMKSYLTIQQYRFPQQIYVEYLLAHNVSQLCVPKMILQPIVENALIHGLREEQENPVITVKAYILEKTGLVVTVTDNGVGMSVQKIGQIMKADTNREKLRFSGIGIHNVDARIKLQFGPEYGLSIFSEEGIFTRVEIHLPVIGNEEVEEKS